MGDSVTTFDGSNLVIEQITVVPGRTTVYNFEVEDFHTYYVSNIKVLVHNNGACPTGLTKMDKYGAAKAFKGKAGVYEHFYSNGSEIVSEIKSYTGKSKNLGGSRPGKSRRVRGRQAGEDYDIGSRFTEAGGGDKALAEMEKKLLDQNVKDGYTPLNSNDVHPENFKP